MEKSFDVGVTSLHHLADDQKILETPLTKIFRSVVRAQTQQKPWLDCQLQTTTSLKLSF
jgi:hypothetical protein